MTMRQRAIAVLIANGFTEAMIAVALGVTRRAVEMQVAKMRTLDDEQAEQRAARIRGKRDQADQIKALSA